MNFTTNFGNCFMMIEDGVHSEVDCKVIPIFTERAHIRVDLLTGRRVRVLFRSALDDKILCDINDYVRGLIRKRIV